MRLAAKAVRGCCAGPRRRLQSPRAAWAGALGLGARRGRATTYSSSRLAVWHAGSRAAAGDDCRAWEVTSKSQRDATDEEQPPSAQDAWLRNQLQASREDGRTSPDVQSSAAHARGRQKRLSMRSWAGSGIKRRVLLIVVLLLLWPNNKDVLAGRGRGQTAYKHGAGNEMMQKRAACVVRKERHTQKREKTSESD